ncbi:MAG: putative membrane protein [Gammaproteobacteria bacterium]|jgi:uncharacterized membrane protein
MSFFILGVIVFFSIHIVPATPLKANIVANIGAGPFKGVFSLISIVGLALIIYGLTQASFHSLWVPPTWSRQLLIAIMPVSIILLCAAELPNNIKRIVRHPMLLGMILWGFGHLLANGDLASTILFASFALFSLTNIFIVNSRGNRKEQLAVSKRWDLAVVVVGLGAYLLLFYFHGSFTGMPLR